MPRSGLFLSPGSGVLLQSFSRVLFLLLYTLNPHTVSLFLFLTQMNAKDTIPLDEQVVDSALYGQKSVDTLTLNLFNICTQGRSSQP